MALTKAGQDKKFLDLQFPDVELKVTSVAYLIYGTIGYTKSEISKPYVLLNLRDYGGNLVLGWMFDTFDIDDMASLLAKAARSPIQITYKLRDRAGSLELLVNEFESYSGSDFPFDKFLGKIDRSEEMFSNANKFLTKNIGEEVSLSLELQTEGFIPICSGRQGGYAMLAWSVLKAVSAYFEGPSIDKRLLTLTAYRGLELYAKHLRNKDKVHIPLRHELMKMVLDESSKGSTAEERNILADCLAALLEISEPTHLYSHIVCEHIKLTQRMLQYSYQYPVMMGGSMKQESDGHCLVKY